MEAKLHRRWGDTNARKASRRSVYMRLAALEGIAERTAKDRFVGYLTPIERLAGQVSNQIAACQDEQRFDMVLETLMPLLRLALEPTADWETAKHQYDNADASEELSQADFDHLVRMGQATRQHWVTYSKHVMNEVALGLRFVAAGELKFT